MPYTQAFIVNQIKKYKETGECDSEEIQKALEDLTEEDLEEREGELSVDTESKEED